MWDAASKEKALDRFVSQYQIDLPGSYAYGDTNGDLSMFEKVGHPVAINPTRELLIHLRKDPVLSQKVEVVVERKDVIYRLSPQVDFLSPPLE
jgi:phosphoserine phosphatase